VRACGTVALARFANGDGAAGNDQITGNDSSNVLNGAGGNDTIVGGIGYDTLQGGDGTNALDGGADTDTLQLIGSANANVNLTTGVATQGGESDTLTSVENVSSGSGDDTIVQKSSDLNYIDAGGGNDTVTGDGYDYLVGGNGNDTLKSTGAGWLYAVDGGPGTDGCTNNVQTPLSTWRTQCESVVTP
jgi:Ca2+-binding RTX toxin-like protein